MLQLALIRQQPDFVKERLLVKNFDASAAISTRSCPLDEKRKKLQLELESAQAGLNAISKEIGQLMAKGEKAEADEKKQQVTSYKIQPRSITAGAGNHEDQLQQLLLTLPNLPASEVPPGKTPTDNIVVREGGPNPYYHQCTCPLGSGQKI